MSLSKETIWKDVRDYAWIVFGLAIYCFSFTAFVLPEKVVTGGVTGLASLLLFAFDWNIAASYYTINIILLAIAYRTVGRQFVIRTVIGATIATLFLQIMTPIFVEPFVKNQPFMNMIIAGIGCGFGLGVVFTHNGSSAGTDIIAAMAAKRTTVSFGRTMLYCDVCIISSSYFIFGSLEKIIYGLVFMVFCSLSSDMFINKSRQTVQFLIVSNKWKELANGINNDAKRGCTLLHGMGWHSKQAVEVLLVLCRRYESVHIFRIIKAIDPEAFVSQSFTNGVYGPGFDEVKVRMGHFKPKLEEGDDALADAAASSAEPIKTSSEP